MNKLGTWTLFKRETNRFLKVYIQTILSPVVSNLLFLTVFGLSLNRANAAIDGVEYLAFIVPGLIAMGLSNNSFQNPSSSLIISKYMGLIDHLMSLPIGRVSMLGAFISSAMLRGMIVGVVTWLSALIFVDLPYYSPLMILVSVLLISGFFSFLGFLVGVWAKEFDNVAFFQNFILTPLVFLGGVFYPIGNLPEPFRTISNFNPIVYMVDLIRYAFLGISHFSVGTDLAVVSVLLVITCSISVWIIKKGWRLQS